MIRTLPNKVDSFRTKRIRQTSRYGLATADIFPTLCAYSKSTPQNEFKGIPSDAFFFARATGWAARDQDTQTHQETA